MKKKIIKTLIEFQDWCKENLQSETALDFETTSLNYLDMEFVGFSMANNLGGIYISNPGCLPYLGNLLKSGLWIFHNAVFDLKCCRKFLNIEPTTIFCTKTGMQIVNENLDSYSLKNLAINILNISSDQIKQWIEVCNNSNSNAFADYAMNDAIWTWQLYQYEKEELKKQNLEHLFYVFEMPFQFILRDLEINGIFIDKKKLEDFKNECISRLVSYKSDMLFLLGKSHVIQERLFEEDDMISPINFNSSKQLIKIIKGLKFKITERTKKGNESAGKTYLQKMLGEHKFFNLLWKYRKLQKLQNSFFEPCEGFINSDGRIRPSYYMVRTGRLACAKPNLQQLPNPKKEKLEFNYREVFVPEKGNIFVKADYSGQELRVLAEVSKDANMVAAFNKNYDLHLLTANRIFNLGLPEQAFVVGSKPHRQAVSEHKRKRHQAKNGVNFPIIYGAFAQRIAKDNKVPINEAQRWLNEFYKLYPGVKKAIEKTRVELEQKGYVETLMGRRRRFPFYKNVNKLEKGRMGRQAFNFKIQGFSADMLKIAAAKIQNILNSYQAKMILTVHDELMYELPYKYAKEFSYVVKDIMENCICLSIPIVADVSIVKSYGD